MLAVAPRRQRMTQTPTLDIQAERDPLATIAVSAAPVVLEGRYRLLMRALWQLRHSRRTRWGVGLGSAAFMLVLAFLAVRHFATTSWPLSRGQPGLLVAAGLLLLLAQALKALGWARLFTNLWVPRTPFISPPDRRTQEGAFTYGEVSRARANNRSRRIWQGCVGPTMRGVS
jgi:hypothetical protein